MRVKLILKLVALWLLFCVRTGSHCSKGVSRYSYTAYKNVVRVLLLFDLNSLVPFPLQCINFFKPMPYWPCQIFLVFFHFSSKNLLCLRKPSQEGSLKAAHFLISRRCVKLFPSCHSDPLCMHVVVPVFQLALLKQHTVLYFVLY